MFGQQAVGPEPPGPFAPDTGDGQHGEAGSGLAEGDDARGHDRDLNKCAPHTSSIRTARGGQWYVSAVQNLLAREEEGLPTADFFPAAAMSNVKLGRWWAPCKTRHVSGASRKAGPLRSDAFEKLGNVGVVASRWDWVRLTSPERDGYP